MQLGFDERLRTFVIYVHALHSSVDALHAIVFLPRDAMYKRGLCRRAVSVCPSVRPFVCHTPVFCRNGYILCAKK